MEIMSRAGVWEATCHFTVNDRAFSAINLTLSQAPFRYPSPPHLTLRYTTQGST